MLLVHLYVQLSCINTMHAHMLHIHTKSKFDMECYYWQLLQSNCNIFKTASKWVFCSKFNSWQQLRLIPRALCQGDGAGYKTNAMDEHCPLYLHPNTVSAALTYRKDTSPIISTGQEISWLLSIKRLMPSGLDLESNWRPCHLARAFFSGMNSSSLASGIAVTLPSTQTTTLRGHS